MQVAHSTFNASFSFFLRSIHGFRFSVSLILSSKFVSRTAFTRQPCSLRFSRGFVDSAFMERIAAVSVPFYNSENFPSSESVWFPKNHAKKRGNDATKIVQLKEHLFSHF
ncbi:hypothetical protein GLYMA_02G216800v4 [Glycine max]|nr:hypothetical protein GLYMA_02G216800v4 [Glycine max]KAH1061496.1 hypothetical protein GYH30_004803 [Glycine max]